MPKKVVSIIVFPGSNCDRDLNIAVQIVGEDVPPLLYSNLYCLNTIQNVKDAGISVCSGGILGLGEEEKDRIGLLHELASLKGGHPESVPINALVAVEGTPIGDSGKAKRVDVFEMVRMIAAARIILPKTMVRLSAGRLEFSQGEQALMFLAGANSIFNGDKLLTTPNPEFDSDTQLFELLGLEGLKPNPRLEHKAEGGHAAARA